MVGYLVMIADPYNRGGLMSHGKLIMFLYHKSSVVRWRLVYKLYMIDNNNASVINEDVCQREHMTPTFPTVSFLFVLVVGHA